MPQAAIRIVPAVCATITARLWGGRRQLAGHRGRPAQMGRPSSAAGWPGIPHVADRKWRV